MTKKSNNKGWRNESARHSLASRGIKTGRNSVKTPINIEEEAEMDAETYNYLYGSGRDADGMMNPNYNPYVGYDDTLSDYEKQFYSDMVDEIGEERARQAWRIMKEYREGDEPRLIVDLSTEESVHPTTKITSANIPPEGWRWAYPEEAEEYGL